MKCNRKKSLPTGEVLREINSENIRNANLYLNYISRSMMLSLRENLGFGRERFRNFNEGHSARGREYIRDYTQEGQAQSEYAQDSYWAIRRDLMADCGWDPGIELWGENPFLPEDMAGHDYGYTDDLTLQERKQYLDFANKMSFFAREMLTMGAAELRNKNRLGAVRLSAVLQPCRSDWFTLMRVYMVTMDTKAVWREMEAMLERFNRMGVFGEETEKWKEKEIRLV